MAEPVRHPPRSRMLWPLLIALLGVLLVIVLLDPLGNADDGTVEDPIVIGEVTETPAGTPGGDLVGSGVGAAARGPAETGPAAESATAEAIELPPPPPPPPPAG